MTGNDLRFLLAGRVTDLELKQETIELGLGQRVGSLLLDRILSGQHKKRFLELIGPPGDGDRSLLHRLQQRGLCLGRRAIDFVRQQDLRKDRPANKLKPTMPRFFFLQDIRSRDVGRHQVRRELDPFEFEIEDA